MWAPLAAVSIGGGIYAYECLDTFLAPGTGFSMDYATPAGPLKITCKTYSVDLLQQTIVANQLLIARENGTPVARVPNLVITGIAVDEGLTPKVQIKDAELWINRDAKGDLDILKFFESSQTGASPQPWQVSIRDSKVHFRDWTTPGGFKNEVLVATGNFAGLGDDVQGTLQADITGLAQGSINVKKKRDLTTISGSGMKANLEAVLTRLRAGQEKKQLESIKPLQVRSGTVSGDFRLELPSGKKTRFSANLVADAAGVQWADYKADSLHYKGAITEQGLTGAIKAQYQGMKADVDGTLSYEKGIDFGGNVKVAGLTPKILNDVKVKLPKEVSFGNSNADGYFTFRNKLIGWQGNAVVDSVSAYGLKTSKVDANLTLNDNQLEATIQPITVGKTILSGSIAYNLKTQAIVGTVSTPKADAHDFSQWLPKEVQKSTGDIVCLIDGSISKPNIMVKGTLDPRIQLQDRLVDFHKADVSLRFDGTKFTLDRLAISDPIGSLYASGDIDLKKGIRVQVVGNGIDLSQLAKDTAGKFDVQGQFSGKLSDPKYSGKLQGYSVAYSGIPGNILAIASNFSGDTKNIQFKSIEAMKGASQITGSLGIGLKDQKLAGLFAVNGIDIRDLYDGPVGGVLDLKNLAVSGTFSEPFVSGSFEAKKVLAHNFAIDSAHGNVNYDGSSFHITDGGATFAKGTISTIKGSISGKTFSGDLSGTFAQLDLKEISQSALAPSSDPDGGSEPPLTASQLGIVGTASGSFDIGIKDKVFSNFISKGRVDDVHLNKALFGSGDWDAGFDGKNWNANAFIGSLDEYFRIDNAKFTPDSGQIGGEFLLFQIPLQELLVAAEPNMNLSNDNLDRLNLVNGKLGAYAQFSGTTSNPTVDLSDFEISNIKLGTEDLGNFSIKGSYANKGFSFKDGLLEGPKVTKLSVPFANTITIPDKLAIPDGTAKLSGSISDKGAVNFTGSIFGFPVNKFSVLQPSLSNVDLFVNKADFDVTGTKDNPTLKSHWEVTAGATPDGKKSSAGILASHLKVQTDLTMHPSNDTKNDGAFEIDTKGGFTLDAIAGSLESHFFLNSGFGLAKTAPLNIDALLDGNRDITSFFKQIDGIALTDNGAKLTGNISIGNRFEDPTISGGLELRSAGLKYTKVQDIIGRPIDLGLNDLTASAKFEKDAKLGLIVKTQASVASSYSHLDPTQPGLGYLAFNAKIPVQDAVDDFVHRVVNGETVDTELPDRQIVDGTLAASRFGIYQSFLQGAYLQATIDTAKEPIKIAGTFTKPKISGNIDFDGVKTILPTLNPTKSGSEESSFDPQFDLTFATKSPINIKSSLAEINAKGNGSLTGSLSDLKANGELTVESGNLFLPGGNVKLTPDGTVTLRYQSTSLNGAQLIANLHGETSLTALKNGLSPERYDISLDIKGNLLSKGASTQNPQDRKPGDSRNDELELTAVSTPGDLSQDRILQLLGRTDLLTNILQSGVNSSVESDVKNAVASYALPGLFNGISSDIAKGFGLDYFGVDYNAFEQASLSFVKGLGSGFYVQGRQQVSQPLPGQPVSYDYRLAFRPRRGPNSIKALSFSLGTDQYRPYKLTIDFSTRVRTRKAPYQSINLHVPNK